MASPNIVRARWAKGKSELFCWSSLGAFTGFMHPPGYALAVNEDPNAPVATHINFLTCKNRGNNRWSPCALSPTPFKDIDPNTSFPCKFILVLGTTEHNVSGDRLDDMVVTYLALREDLPPSFNLAYEIGTCSPMSFVKEFFKDYLETVPITDVHLRELNQVSGPIFATWKWNPEIAERDSRLFHQMRLGPDRWMNGWGGFQPRKLITAPSSTTLVPGVWYTTSNDFISKVCHTKKLVQYCNSKTLFFYHRFLPRDEDFGKYSWVPMPSTRPGYCRYAVMYNQSKANLDSLMCRLDSQEMDAEVFEIEVEDILFQSKMDFVELPILHCGGTYFGYRVVNFITVVLDLTCDPTAFGAQQVGSGCWMLFLDRNCDDLRVPGCGEDAVGVVSGRHSLYPKAVMLTCAHKKLLRHAFPKAGLKRFRTHHKGSFYMIGERRGSISSGSMSQVSPSYLHHYYDESEMNASLLSFTAPITHELARQAISVRDNCGQVQMGICRAALLKYEGVVYRSSQLAPHIILTGPLQQLSFSNNEHVDSEDCMDPTTNKFVYDYIDNSGCKSLVDSVAKNKDLFRRRLCTEGTKNIPDKWLFNLPTTCVWSPVHDPTSTESQEYRHVQQFILPETGASWDLSCNVFSDEIPQVTGTFSSGYISHVTSCSIWINESSGMVTTLCPNNRCNLAWGTDNKPLRRKKKTRSGATY